MEPDLTDISNQILTLLAALNDKYEVSHWPDDPDDYTLTHPAGAVLLIFTRWRFSEPQDTVGGTQPTGIEFQVSTISRSLLPKDQVPGAYTIIKDVYNSLKGQLIEHNYLFCTDIRLISQDAGQYHYGQKWTLKLMQL